VIGDALAITLMNIKNFKPHDFALFHSGCILGRRLLLKVKDVKIPKKSCSILNTIVLSIADVIISLSDKEFGVELFPE